MIYIILILFVFRILADSDSVRCRFCFYNISVIVVIDSLILKDELMDVTTNKELKLKFKEGYQVFWLQNMYIYFILDYELLCKHF